LKSINKYYYYKNELSDLLKDRENISFHEDEVIIDKIINLLTEGKSVDKIRSIISATEIIKYGGDIRDLEAENIYHEIIAWWKSKSQ